jgi:hypothetical protein
LEVNTLLLMPLGLHCLRQSHFSYVLAPVRTSPYRWFSSYPFKLLASQLGVALAKQPIEVDQLTVHGIGRRDRSVTDSTLSSDEVI